MLLLSLILTLVQGLSVHTTTRRSRPKHPSHLHAGKQSAYRPTVISTCVEDARDALSPARVEDCCMTPKGWSLLHTGKGWKPTYPRKFGATLIFFSAYWMQTGRHRCRTMTKFLLEDSAERMIQTKPRCSRSFNNFFFEPLPSWDIWTRRRDSLLMFFAGRRNMCSTSLPQNSLRAVCPKHIEISYCSGLQIFGSAIAPGLDPLLRLRDVGRLQRFWKTKAFARPRGGRRRCKQASTCPFRINFGLLALGLQAVGWQLSRSLSTRPGPKSGAHFPQSSIHAPPRKLWLLLLFITYLGQVGGVKVGYQDTGYPGAQQSMGIRSHHEAKPCGASTTGQILGATRTPALKRAYRRAVNRAPNMGALCTEESG